jgi:ferredoxin-NADP reductase
MEDLNATVLFRQDYSIDLFVLRVKPDQGSLNFSPGQFAVIGLPANRPGSRN